MTNKQNSPNLGQFDFAVMLNQARAMTGLNGLGCESFAPALKQLLFALENEANLNATGREVFRARILGSLCNRLRMEAWIGRHPQILEEELPSPLVIAGLPRTGTTMLHRVLASDSRFFAPLWYEVRNPAPYLDWIAGATDQRVVEARAEVQALLEANPEIAAIHPMDPEGADEEILLLEHSFYSYLPNAFAEVPSYSRWVGEQDNGPAYRYLRRQLQFLQWQKRQRGEDGQRWLLKTPHHMHFMDKLFDVFPDAQVVATHRDPAVTIPSIASFNYNLWLTCCDEPSKTAVAQEWLMLFANGARTTARVRAKREARFLDVWFEDSVARPFDVIADVYRFIKMDFTPEARAAMETHRNENRREDRAAHQYGLEEFGLSRGTIRELFSDYYQRFIDSR